MDFSITQGYSKRIQITALNRIGTAYDFTSSTVNLIVKKKSSDVTPLITKTLTVDGSGVGTSTTGISLGQPDPTSPTGALINTTAASGYLTVHFAPADTSAMTSGAYLWEAQTSAAGGADEYALQTGTLTIVDSLFGTVA